MTEKPTPDEHTEQFNKGPFELSHARTYRLMLIDNINVAEFVARVRAREKHR